MAELGNRVKAGIFSFTPEAPDDDGYLQWHLLDHMPEQYRLPGIVLGQRWTADADLRARRLVGTERWADLANVVNYLVGDPVEETLSDFIDLGHQLVHDGRMSVIRPSIGVAMVALHDGHAAPAAEVSSCVVPFRPHRGVMLVVEPPREPSTPTWAAADLDRTLALPGVAGLWSYEPSTTWQAPSRVNPRPVRITVVYLDGDVLATSAALTPVLDARWRRESVEPLFAGPLRTMISYDAWP